MDDELGRIVNSDLALPGLTPHVFLTQGYDANSNRTQLSAAVGSTADFVNNYTFDNLDRLTQITQTGVTGGNSVDPKRVDLTYLDNGLLSTVSRYAGTDTSNPVAASAYGYDRASRLTGLSYSFPAGSDPAPSYSWQYDDAGRVTQFVSAADGTKNYGYDRTGQLTADGAATHSYDLAGNRTPTARVTLRPATACRKTPKATPMNTTPREIAPR